MRLPITTSCHLSGIWFVKERACPPAGGPWSSLWLNVCGGTWARHRVLTRVPTLLNQPAKLRWSRYVDSVPWPKHGIPRYGPARDPRPPNVAQSRSLEKHCHTNWKYLAKKLCCWIGVSRVRTDKISRIENPSSNWVDYRELRMQGIQPDQSALFTIDFKLQATVTQPYSFSIRYRSTVTIA